jgi:hypothetical protein
LDQPHGQRELLGVQLALLVHVAKVPESEKKTADVLAIYDWQQAVRPDWSKFRNCDDSMFGDFQNILDFFPTIFGHTDRQIRVYKAIDFTAHHM